MSRVYLLQRAFEYENKLDNYSNNRKLRFFDAFIGYQIQGVLTESAINTTLKNFTLTPNCGAGIFPYDPRCRYWYIQTLKHDSLIFMEPNLIFSTVIPFVGAAACQKLFQYNQYTKQKEIFSVFCMDIQLVSMKKYFQNFSSQTIQFYFIEPRSQKILYNSNQLQEVHNNTIYTLNQVELQYLQDQQEARYLNKTIKDNYSSWINETMRTINLENSNIVKTEQKQIQYTRNGTKTTVILSPAVVIDKIGKYQNYDKWDNGNPNKFNIEIPYLQINILSDEDLKAQSKKLEEFFHRFFIAISIALGFLAVVSIIFTLFYARRIKNMLNSSVESLTLLLKQLSDEEIRDDIFSLYTEDMFLSSETRQLYESFQGIYQILLQTSENFFEDNETITLLKLTKNIEFFKQFGNIDAVGITLNNIGSILLSQKHYFEALDQFSQSVIYAKYQISEFCKCFPTSLSSHLLADYSYDTQFYLYINKQQLQSNICYSDASGSLNNPTKKVSDYNKSSISQKSRRQIQQQSRVSKKSTQINNSSQAILPNKLYEYGISNIFRNNLTDSKLIGYNKNYIQTRFQQYSQDKMFKLNLTKYGNEEHYEQRIDLLSNLYFRKRNYIIALIALQENSDQIYYASLSKYSENKKCNNQNNSCLYNNFWHEIKSLLAELLIIAKQLPFGDSQEIDIYAMISKCQFQLNKQEKSKKTLQQCEYLLNQLQKSQQSQQKQQQVSPQLEQISPQTDQTKENTPPVQAPVQPEVQSNFSLNSNAKNQNLVIVDNLSFNQKSMMQSNMDFYLQKSQIQPNQNDISNVYDDIKLTTNKDNVVSLQENKQTFDLSMMGNFQEFFLDQSVNSPLNLNKNNKLYQSTTPFSNIQMTNKLSSLHGDNDFLEIESDIIQNEETPKLDFSSNILAQSGLILKKIQSDPEQTIDIQSPKFYSKLIQKNSQPSNYKKQQQFSSNLLLSKQIQNKNNISSGQRQKSKSISQFLQQSKKNSNIQFCKSVDNTLKRSLMLSPEIQEKRQISLQPRGISFDVKTKQGFLLPSQSERKDIEELFQHHRKVQNIIQDDYQLLNCLSVDTQDLIIRFTKTELLLKQQNFKSAALILTQLLEDKKYIMSHYPFKIFHHLKTIFDSTNITCKEINHIIKKFNPNISIQVAMIFACAQHNKQIFKATQLTSNLVSKVLDKIDDQFGLTLVDQQDDYIQMYMTLTKVNQIKNIMSQIVKEILQTTSKKTADTFYELYSLTQVSEEILNEDKESIKNIPYQEQSQSLTQDNRDNSDSLYFSNKFNIRSKQASFFNASLIKPYQEQKNIHNEQILEENDSSKHSFDQQFQQQSFQLIRSQSYENELFASQHNNKQFNGKVMEQHLGDAEIMLNNSLDLQDIAIQEQTSIQVESENYQRNEQFHLCMRKTLSQYFTVNPFRNQFLNKDENENKSQDKNQSEEIKFLFEVKNKYTSEQKKFIIYSTDKISIIKNQLFHELCFTLHSLNIQLLMFSFNKSSNFLELLPDLTYYFQEKEIIKIFYSNQKILNYIQNQRDKFWKTEYPTIIQHF